MVPPYVRRPAQERQLAFNPEAPTFSPNAPAFQSTSIPSPAAQATSSGGYYDGYGTPPPYRGLTTANSHRNDGGYEAGNAASSVPPFPSDPWMMNTIQAPAAHPLPPIETRASFQGAGTVEVVSPSPRRFTGATMNLEAHPMALEHLKDPNTVSAPLRKAELEMAKNNPQGWASLAKDNLIALVDLYTPNTIPQEIMEAHYEKYKDVYRKYTSLGKSPPADALPTGYIAPNADHEVPKGAVNLANAHAAAINAFQSHPGDSSTDPNFEALQPKYGGPKYAPAVDRRATATAYSEEELMSTPYRHGQTNRNPRGAQTFSPGPAFPALGQEPGLRYNSPSHLPQATNANIRATGPYAADHTQQHRFNGPPVVGAESPHPPWQRRFGAEQPHHTSNYSSNSLENYVNVRPARRTHRTGPRHRKNKTPRPKRIDQGPEPSNADIYPDDDAFVAVQEENGRRYDLDATMHAGMYNMTLGDFNEEPTEMWSSPPHPSSSPHNIQDVQAQMANPVCAINPAYLPVWPSEQDVEDIPDGVSDLGHLSPLSTDSYPDMEGSSAYTATPAGASRRPKLTLPPAEQLRPMEPDQIDGSRYGLKNGGLGLHSVGDVWMPPKPKPGTQFADMGYLWDSAEPSARAR